MASTSDHQPPSESSSRCVIFLNHFIPFFSTYFHRGTPTNVSTTDPTLRGLATPVVSYAPRPRPLPPPPPTPHHTPRPLAPTSTRREQHQTNPSLCLSRCSNTSLSPRSTTARCTGGSPARLPPPQPIPPMHTIGLPCTKHEHKRQSTTLTDDGLLRRRGVNMGRGAYDTTGVPKPHRVGVGVGPLLQGSRSGGFLS